MTMMAQEEAARFLVGGVNSPVRAYKQVGGEPVILARGRGAEVADAAGRTYVDFLMGWGALILGHQAPPVIRALRQQLRHSTILGLTHPAEVELARLIAEAVPSVEQVRFTASGTEACLTAVKLARACTGRDAVILFDGGYHGHVELPARVIRVPFNDVDALEAALKQDGASVACVMVEPVPANTGVLVPQADFLARLRRLTSACGALLVFDEVVTGFRLGPAGAQGRFAVAPDLTVFGKIIGGGLPIGAVGGPRRLMRRLAPEGEVYHAGTFAGHPLSMVAGAAVLRALKARPPYQALERRSAALARGLDAAARRAGVPVQVNRVGSMLTMFFSERPVRCAADARATDRARFARWAAGLRREGVLVPPSACEAFFVSSAHAPRHLERMVQATERVLRRGPS